MYPLSKTPYPDADFSLGTLGRIPLLLNRPYGI